MSRKPSRMGIAGVEPRQLAPSVGRGRIGRIGEGENKGNDSIRLHSFTLIIPSTENTVYFLQVLFYSLQTSISFHTICLILCFQQNQWDLQPHCKLGQSILVVLCAGSMLLSNADSVPYQMSDSSNLQKWFFSPTGRLKFGFILRENSLLCSSYLPLGVSQQVLWDIKTDFWHRCRGERWFLQGESLTSNLFTLLLFCLVSLLSFVYFFIKNTQKN
jgi:hypothetical protein